MTPILACRTAASPNSRLITPKQQRGFTLLEIILVLAIIATASVMVVSNLGGFEARTFSTQVRQAQSLLNYARRTAVISGQASTVSFNVLPGDEMGQIDEEEYASLNKGNEGKERTKRSLGVRHGLRRLPQLFGTLR
jgi:prepilin-type N-terminal cleavage/methylation domain-containing protein